MMRGVLWRLGRNCRISDFTYRCALPSDALPFRNPTNLSTFSTHGRFVCTTSFLLDKIHSLKTPAFAESVTSGDIRWVKQAGESVKSDEIIAEIETDKTSIPVNSPVNGTIETILIEDGGVVTAHQEIAFIKAGDVAAGETQSKVPSGDHLSKPAEVSSKPGNLETTKMPDQAPVISIVPEKSVLAIPGSDKSPTVSEPTLELIGSFSRNETRVKMNRMRLKIAKRLKEAQNTAAMLTTFNEVDMSNAIDLRTKYKDAFLKKHNFKLSFMSTFIKASIYALQDSPTVNAVIDDNTNEIVYRDYIDISVAVATPKGLVVPVLRNCNYMNFAAIEQGLAKLSEKARNNALAIEDMDGGSFTISNGGVFGSLFGTPILNPPQSAILGMHAITERPMVVEGKVEIRPVMFVALTYDHRLLDGREAVLFLKKIKSAVEDPRFMLLGL